MVSRLSIVVRTAIVLVGLLVVLGGFVARAFEEMYGAGIDSEIGVRADGTAVIYDIIDTDASYQVEDVDEATAVVYRIQNDSEARTEVFRGTPDDAHAYYLEQTRVLVFEGPQEEAEAWDEARHEDRESMLIPNLVIATGVLIVGAGLVIGWRRTPTHGTDTPVHTAQET